MIFELIISIIYIVLRVYQGILFLSIIFSWIPGIKNSWFGIQVTKMSSWYFDYYGNNLVVGGINFAPWIALILYDYVINLLWI